VYVPPHPLVKHWLAVTRNAQTPPPIFKSAITELSKLLLYECVRDMLPTQQAQVETPLGVMADVEFIDPSCPVALVPVLRAGLAMAEAAQTIIPASTTYHIGYARDESTLLASAYLNRLPSHMDMDTKVVVMDIMLATGAFPCLSSAPILKLGQHACQSFFPMLVICIHDCNSLDGLGRECHSSVAALRRSPRASMHAYVDNLWISPITAQWVKECTEIYTHAYELWRMCWAAESINAVKGGVS
jgi:uracil phosphoribosyltransferase